MDISNLHFLTRTSLLLALTIYIQAFSLPQTVAGPLVNMMLIITVLVTGVAGGVTVGGLTPGLAIFFGIMPGQMLPVLPFIVAGNALYCSVFWVLRKYPLPGLAAASLVKFAVIGGAGKLFLSLPAPLGQILFFPQLINALAGGVAGILVGTYLLRLPGLSKSTFGKNM